MDSPASELEKMDVGEGADRKLLIAVDFGTTFSGVAWAQTRRVIEYQTENLDSKLTSHTARCPDNSHPMAR